MAEVTCIMPTHNSARVVALGVQSVLHQDMDDWRLIVVDDSADGTLDVVASLVGDDPRVTLVRLSAWTPISRKRDLGIAMADTAWIAEFDCDDVHPACRLRVQRAAAETAEIVHVPYPRWCAPGRDSCLWRLRPHLGPTEVNAGGTLFFSRDWWWRIRGHDDSLVRGCDSALRRKMQSLGLDALPSPSAYADGFVGIDHGGNNWGYRLNDAQWERTDAAWRTALPDWALPIIDSWNPA